MRNIYFAAIACVSLVAATSSAAETYEAAYKAMKEEGKSLVVLVGADWCPACQTMKTNVMPKLETAGKLKDVAFATVNIDHQARIGRSMMEGNLIPQLVIYTKTEKGWKLERLIGGQSVEAVEKFLASNAKAQEKAEAAVATVGQSK
jgi:thioredoxin-like negative regulator of GroEL